MNSGKTTWQLPETMGGFGIQAVLLTCYEVNGASMPRFFDDSQLVGEGLFEDHKARKAKGVEAT